MVIIRSLNIKSIKSKNYRKMKREKLVCFSLFCLILDRMKTIRILMIINTYGCWLNTH